MEVRNVKGQFIKGHPETFTWKGMNGDKHPSWKGGRFMDAGYWVVYYKNHPRGKKPTYVYEHILVAENKLGRPLTKGEVVHHINGVKTDNRIENIKVFKSNVEHAKHHRRLQLESKSIHKR